MNREELIARMSDVILQNAGKTILTILNQSIDIAEQYAESKVSELKAEIPKWISVEERMPKEWESILMVGGSVRSSGIYMENEFHSDFKLPLHKDVTHWMPLPQPPTEK